MYKKILTSLFCLALLIVGIVGCAAPESGENADICSDPAELSGDGSVELLEEWPSFDSVDALKSYAEKDSKLLSRAAGKETVIYAPPDDLFGYELYDIDLAGNDYVNYYYRDVSGGEARRTSGFDANISWVYTGNGELWLSNVSERYEDGVEEFEKHPGFYYYHCDDPASIDYGSGYMIYWVQDGFRFSASVPDDMLEKFFSMTDEDTLLRRIPLTVSDETAAEAERLAHELAAERAERETSSCSDDCSE